MSDHVQHTWNLTRGSDEIAVDLWTDDDTVHVTGGRGEQCDGGRTAAERLVAQYVAAGYRVASSYPVNEPEQHAEAAADEREPAGKPEACPECEQPVEFARNHTDGFREGDAWLCTGCRWGEWIAK